MWGRGGGDWELVLQLGRWRGGGAFLRLRVVPGTTAINQSINRHLLSHPLPFIQSTHPLQRLLPPHTTLHYTLIIHPPPASPELHADLRVALVERLAGLEEEGDAVPARVVDCCIRVRWCGVECGDCIGVCSWFDGVVRCALLLWRCCWTRLCVFVAVAVGVGGASRGAAALSFCFCAARAAVWEGRR